MHSGKGILIFRNGKRVPVEFQFGSDYDDSRSGYLLCDTSKLDPALLIDRLTVECDDGKRIVVAVMHSSDRHLAVIGRVAAPSPEMTA